MAIEMYDNWYSIIIKMDSIARIYGENGFKAFLKEFFPEPPKKMRERRRGKTRDFFLYSLKVSRYKRTQMTWKNIRLMIILSCNAPKDSIT